MWLHAPNLGFTHGFSVRAGGVSQGVHAGLNLSGNVGDQVTAVAENRRLALETLGLGTAQLARLRQVHSSIVSNAQPDMLPEADALVTREPNLALVIETADCYPVLLEDAEAGVIGAAHAGWRGTVAGVALNTLRAMIDLGARADRIKVAIGPGISGPRYEVGSEVRERFMDAGFPHGIWTESRTPALVNSGASQGAILSSMRANQEIEPQTGLSWHVDLGLANAWLLEAAGVPKASIWRAGLCSTDERFFSYRRDHGQTGRMWAVIARTNQNRRAS
jgi:polyphenol oxidase